MRGNAALDLTMPTITVAPHSGYCFGVKRAVEKAEGLLNAGTKIATLGPVIHNPQMVKRLAGLGAVVIDSPQDAPPGYTVLIRAHGVGKHVYDELERLGIPYADATCPDVRRVHTIAAEQSAMGKVILIAGERTHPEVIGTIGHISGEWHCFSSLAELGEIAEKHSLSRQKSCVLLAQTTFNASEWKKCRDFAKNVYTNLTVFDTICNATILRQNEAARLARESDVMVVVGGKDSSNTVKLAQVCRGHCRTFHIEGPESLSGIRLEGAQRIGVTAGASTPAFIIKEVHKIMSDVLNHPEEESFEEMLDSSFKTIHTGERVKATVTNVGPNEIAVEVGTKQSGYIPMNEFTDDPNAKLSELVAVGDELELLVQRVNDVEGTAMLSKKRLDAMAGFEKVMAAADTEEILEGVVVEIVKGGLLALTSGVRVFIPASQATVARGQELEPMLRQKVSFRILEVNRQRRRAVGSIRAALREQNRALEAKFWEAAAVGNIYNGAVKSLTSYGAFVDLGGVDGMVHISELSWSRVKHPSDVLAIGDIVEVYIKDIDPEKKKISLGYKKTEDNPWEVLRSKYAAGDTAAVEIVSLTPFGAFARLIPGVDGLIHVSQISTERVEKPGDVLKTGQEVDVLITGIDYEKKRVSLSIRALLEAQNANRETENAEDTDGGLVYEAAPPEVGEAPDQEEPAGEDV
ncbi:MAG: bifunctional 4-hydroxy-3-methylbut-2-enyl diphosphate reductase/30S ribosomal protein S1 [Oscillospiraceae bacterium]|nr:bifunctional 4-hydroxy-3-methylbut-2-enyl diphosphate reductase/30S ribosomal protein S1 [Oscillospiraceae bacterium]